VLLLTNGEVEDESINGGCDGVNGENVVDEEGCDGVNGDNVENVVDEEGYDG
jgi:hypothetical protein